MKYTFPTATYGNNAVLMQIDAALLPIVADKLRVLSEEHVWIDINSWRAGYNAIAEMLLMQNGIVESINRLYMLLDNRLTGTPYGLVNGLPPAVPAVPTQLDPAYGGLLPDLLALRGGTPDGWFGLPGSTPISLKEIVSALRAGQPSELETMLDKIDLLGDATDISTLYTAVKGTAVDMASLAEGGGTLATLIVATLAQAAMMGLQAGQLDTLIASMNRLVTSLDGGATPSPATNVIAELQGVNEKLV